MRLSYGVRLKMLHERQALLNGLSQMFSSEAKPLDPELFCWTGQLKEYKPPVPIGDTPADHAVDVLVAKMRELRSESNPTGFDIDELTKTFNEFMGPYFQATGTKMKGDDDGSQ